MLVIILQNKPKNYVNSTDLQPVWKYDPTVHCGAVFRANGNARLVKMSLYTYLPYE